LQSSPHSAEHDRIKRYKNIKFSTQSLRTPRRHVMMMSPVLCGDFVISHLGFVSSVGGLV
jgi:hypothetical protein